METLKANELRIGNYYDDNGTIRQVTPNTILDVWEAERTWCKPIPLTEEWLVKLGGCCCLLNIGKVIIRSHLPNMKPANFYAYIDGIMIKKIKTVHEAQNLYFALTGNELTIKS